MRRTETRFRREPDNKTPWWLFVAVQGPGVLDWPGLVLRLLLFPIGAAISLVAFFLPAVPFALALLPLFAGLWSGAATVRFTTMTSFMIWPVFLAAWGLHGLDVGAPELVWSLAAALVVALGLLAAQIGIVPATLLVTLFPVFPASPLLPLAALLPGLGPPALFGTLTGLALIEATRKPRRRRGLLAILTTCLGIWTMGHALIREHVTAGVQTGWTELSEPISITKRARWIALRDLLPDDSTVILGENIFAAENTEARAFWCRVVTTRNLTLYLGVAEPYGAAARGAVWRLDAQSCTTPKPHPATLATHRASLGIPHLTGTWGLMGGRMGGLMANRVSEAAGFRSSPQFDWLICLEAFLPWAWAGLLTDTARDRQPSRPLIVLSNDTSFRPLPSLPPVSALGAPPVHVLRRKAATAMAGLTGRTVFFAETARTVLIRHPEAK